MAQILPPWKQRLREHFYRLADAICRTMASGECEDYDMLRDLLNSVEKDGERLMPGKSVMAMVLSRWRRGYGELSDGPKQDLSHAIPGITVRLNDIREQEAKILDGVGRIEQRTEKFDKCVKNPKRKYLNLPRSALQFAAKTWIDYRYATDCITPKRGLKIGKADVFDYKQRELKAHKIMTAEDFVKAVDNARRQFPELFPKFVKRQSRKKLSR